MKGVWTSPGGGREGGRAEAEGGREPGNAWQRWMDGGREREEGGRTVCGAAPDSPAHAGAGLPLGGGQGMPRPKQPPGPPPPVFP